MRTVTHPFNGLAPSTVDTFAACALGRLRQRLRTAASLIRRGPYESDSDYMHSLNRAAHHVGVADGMVHALYDVNHDAAYASLTHVRRVSQILESALRLQLRRASGIPGGLTCDPS
jgi:hypothetical protein